MWGGEGKLEFILLFYSCCIPKLSGWIAEAACWRRQVPDTSLLLQIAVGLSQTNTGRLSSNVWGVNTPSWHDTHCQRLQTSSRRRKYKFYPASFFFYLVAHSSHPRGNAHFSDEKKTTQIYLVQLKSAFCYLSHCPLYKETRQAGPCPLHVPLAWDPPNGFSWGPGPLHRKGVGQLST